jgi:hypothetical protein
VLQKVLETRENRIEKERAKIEETLKKLTGGGLTEEEKAKLIDDAGKQINAMKVQLYFQLREFGKVDELLKKALLLDARTRLIKLVRMYKKEDPALDKFFQRKFVRLKGDDGAFAACVYAWMKVRQEKYDDAVAVLVRAKKLSDNAVLLENHERLVNKKYKHFTNAGFGDQWYSLYLEEPKVKMQRQQQRMF